jgi:maltose alpha-D-glucosyltransferase / alpha-amylase
MYASKPQVEAALAAFLQAQRWFGGKARGLKAVRIVDWGPFLADDFVAMLTFVNVELGDGATNLYFIPVIITENGGATVVDDALAEDSVRVALLEAIAHGREFATMEGRVRAFSTTAFAELRGQADEALPAVLAAPTSSNSLIQYGNRLLLKVFRRPEPGVNPDLEIGRFLTERSGFSHIPRLAGAVEYLRPGSAPMTLAILQELEAHQADGWAFTLEELGRYFERAASDRAGPNAAAAEKVVGAYPSAAAMLGRRTAELHDALSDDHGAPDFTPEPLTSADLEALTADSREQVRLALAALRGGKSNNRSPGIEESLQSLVFEPPTLGSSALASGKIRCHGDYHLGQVLYVNGDFVILDFEGEPTRTIEERRAKQSPLKDVAGMLRSFDYAAYAGLFAFTQNRPDDFAQLAPWAELWRLTVSAAFLGSYRDAAGGAAFLPNKPEVFSALLDAYILNKAFYELVYELNNRPDWVRIPLQGILALAGRGRRPNGSAPTKG